MFGQVSVRFDEKSPSFEVVVDGLYARSSSSVKILEDLSSFATDFNCLISGDAQTPVDQTS